MNAIGYDHRVAEALSAVAEPDGGVEDAARVLGTSRRTLERLTARHTGRPPVFWSQLARVRTAARALVSGDDPVETAYETGYADQARTHWSTPTGTFPALTTASVTPSGRRVSVPHDSFVPAENLHTIPKNVLDKHTGTLNDATMSRVSRAVVLALGLEEAAAFR